MEIFLLGFLVLGGSIALLGDAFDSSDDPVTEDDGSDIPDSPTVEGEVLLFDGESTLAGTEGNDTIYPGQDPDLVPEEIYLLDGDDVATIDTQVGGVVSGGGGDDHIVSTDYGTPLEGGEGDDTLSGIGANNMSGGAGNDSIIFDNTGGTIDAAAVITGDEGDDTISGLVNVGIDAPDYGGAILFGGEGNDSFDILMEVKNSANDLDGGGLETGTVRIADFDPAEDSLVIDFGFDEESEGREFQTDFEQTEEDGRFLSTFTFTFLEDETMSDAAEAIARLRVMSNAPFGLEDVSILSTQG
ncbi:calcium-binding protein [Cribrihabitans sp. XS_ASV171]